MGPGPRLLTKPSREDEGDALGAPKSAKWKMRIARELRTRSTATNAWIAQRLAMGHPTRVMQSIAYDRWMASKRLMLSPPERRELSRRLRSRSVRSEDARRADVILRSARGQSVREIAGALGCSTSYVQRWTNRFRQTRLSGLVAQHRGRKARGQCGRSGGQSAGVDAARPR